MKAFPFILVASLFFTISVSAKPSKTVYIPFAKGKSRLSVIGKVKSEILAYKPTSKKAAWAPLNFMPTNQTVFYQAIETCVKFLPDPIKVKLQDAAAYGTPTWPLDGDFIYDPASRIFGMRVKVDHARYFCQIYGPGGKEFNDPIRFCSDGDCTETNLDIPQIAPNFPDNDLPTLLSPVAKAIIENPTESKALSSYAIAYSYFRESLATDFSENLLFEADRMGNPLFALIAKNYCRRAPGAERFGDLYLNVARKIALRKLTPGYFFGKVVNDATIPAGVSKFQKEIEGSGWEFYGPCTTTPVKKP